MINTNTFGTGPDAVRVISSGDSCELRFGQRMIRGNSHLQKLLDYIYRDIEGAELEEFASGFNLSSEVMASKIGSTLRSLAEAGIPLQTWGVHWSAVAHGQEPSVS